MKSSTLRALRDARRNKQTIGWITDLETGDEALLIDGEIQLADFEVPAAAIEFARTTARTDRDGEIEVDGRRLFCRAFAPPRRLFVVGAVHIAQSLTSMAGQLEYAVTLIDPRDSWATPERFPNLEIDRRWPDEALADQQIDRRTAIVTLSHDPKIDEPALECALRAGAFYVGALGSRRTHARRLERLAARGLSATELDRIHAPVGLDIGAVSPAEIAVSILAELTQRLRGAD